MNKTVIVTGGAKGIGAAISSLFAKSGYNVIVNYNTSEAAAKALCAELTTNGYSCLPYKADISNSTEVQSLFKFAIDNFGKIDVVINNAGISQQKLITDITDMDYNKMIATNLSGVFYCCREAAKYMIKEKNGAGVLSDISYATPTAPGFSLPYYWQFYVWGTKGMASFSVNGKEPCYFTFENSEQQPLIEEEIERDYLTDFIEMVEGRECTLPMEDVFTATRETLTIQKFSDNKGE